MNFDKLYKLEESFYEAYPGGMEHPEMQAISKKHHPEKMSALVQEAFGKDNFNNPEARAEDMIKIITRSSMVSVFEKPRFRDTVRAMSGPEKTHLVLGLKEQLHGDYEAGFNQAADVLGIYKLAKWTLITILPLYYRPLEEVYIKPTTVKGLIDYFEMEGLKYTPKANYPFYRDYKEALLELKSHSRTALATADNAAFSGICMMMTGGWGKR